MLLQCELTTQNMARMSTEYAFGTEPVSCSRILAYTQLLCSKNSFPSNYGNLLPNSHTLTVWPLGSSDCSSGMSIAVYNTRYPNLGIWACIHKYIDVSLYGRAISIFFFFFTIWTIQKPIWKKGKWKERLKHNTERNSLLLSWLMLSDITPSWDWTQEARPLCCQITVHTQCMSMTYICEHSRDVSEYKAPTEWMSCYTI